MRGAGTGRAATEGDRVATGSRHRLADALLVAAWTLLLVHLSGFLVRAGGYGAVPNMGWQAATEWAAALVCWAVYLGSGRSRPEVGYLAVAATAFAAGVTYFLVLMVRGVEPAFPSWADAGFLLFYPPTFAAIAVVVRRRLPARGSAVLGEALVACLGAAAGLAVVLDPVVAAATAGPRMAASVVALAYPLLDAALICLLLGVSALRGLRTGRRMVPLLGGLLVFAVGDVIYALRMAYEAYVFGTPLDAGWSLGLVLIATWVRRLDRPTAQRAGSVRLPTAPLAVLSTAVALGVLVLATRSDLPTAAVVLAVLTLVAATARQQSAVRHLARLADLRRQADTDELTGLPNRRALATRLEDLLAKDRAEAAQHGLLLLDLDGFKDVNDTLGHNSGDQLLQEVARRLTSRVRATDLVARLGGDEFAILVADAPDQDGLAELGRGLLREIERPVAVAGGEAKVSGSIGVVPFTGGGFEQLLGDSDLAMYRAKGAGRNQVVLFDPRLRRAAEQRVALQSDLRQALDRGELEVWYQPIVDLATGTWVGAEALSRWLHPTRGPVPPSEFVALAEEVGLVGEIGAAAFASALPVIRRCKAQLPATQQFGLGLNVSPRELDQPDFVDRVLRGCLLTGIPTDALVLELTESTLMADGGNHRARLAALREAGVRIAIDDFGTGYSSLSYLTRLPIDILKLDPSFVAALGTGHRDEAVIRAAAGLARDLDLILVAEGVETREQVAALLDLGCRLGQGFHLQQPMPEADFVRALLTGSRSRLQPARS